ncbi:MAG: hypothetical protein JXB18_14305 [Sedimentisphaerales bacterium]|nr:hypothetical protein [Sedimentisphaerales bacterium]
MKNAFLPGMLFIAGGFVYTIIRLQLIGYRYDRYLRQNHFDQWKQITTVFGQGPGLLNSWRAWKFLFSEEYFGDKELLFLKKQTRRAWFYVLSGFLISLIAMIVLGIMMQE